MDFLFDYLQVFTWPDGETLPGVGEIPEEDLTPENIVIHVPPEMSLVAVDIVLTGDASEILIVEHIAPSVAISSSPTIEYDGTLIINHVPPLTSFTSDITASVITSIAHVPPDIVFESSAIQLLSVIVHLPAGVSFSNPIDIAYDGTLVVQHEPPTVAFSNPVITTNLGTVPTWYTGQLVAHVPPVAVFAVPDNAIGTILNFIAPTFIITTPSITVGCFMDVTLSDSIFAWDEPDWDLSLLISEALEASDTPTFQLCLLLADYIKAIDALSAQQSLTMRASDTIYAVDSVDRIAIIAATLTDAIAIVDAPAFIITALISDYMTTRDAVSHNLTGTKTISDTIAVTDAVVAGWLLGLIESLDIADVVNNLRENTLSISETATISEVLTGLGVYGVRIQDAAGISDYAQTIVELLISESLVATDTTTYLKDIYLALAETLGATDALVASLNVYLSLTDNLVAIDTASNTGVFGVTITEGLKIDVSVEIDGELFECYVLSTPKFLPSIYSGFNFNSYCEFQGRAFGANATGIFELTGDTDNGTTIHTGATFHETDFGARNDKRFRKAYLGVSGTSPVMIMETGEGERTVYSIDDKGKVDASRSVHSRDWTLSVSDFDELDTVHLVPVILARGK